MFTHAFLIENGKKYIYTHKKVENGASFAHSRETLKFYGFHPLSCVFKLVFENFCMLGIRQVSDKIRDHDPIRSNFPRNL